MAPPSTRMAVTVAPPTGSFDAFLTMPTIAPDDTLTVGASDPSARTAGRTNAVATADNRKLWRCFFIDGIPLISCKPEKRVDAMPNHDVTAPPRSRAIAVYDRGNRSVDQSALKKARCL